MGHTMKLWEKVIEHRFRLVTTISDNLFGVVPEKLTMEAIYLLRRLIEKYREKKRIFTCFSIDQVKAYDRGLRDII